MISLVLKLAKNDFKKRYAGSVLGALWAFLQPVVTIVMYYLVFEVVGRGAMRAQGDVPYVLFLTAGLVPWFYFSEALPQGTQAFLEYGYLVKKILFPIQVLPMVKTLAASLIHCFFILVLFFAAIICGYKPSLNWIQVFYYSAALYMLILGLSYISSSIVIFFRDLAQIINIGLQMGIWATPIMWDINVLSRKWQILFKLNPLTYIVNGYRGAVFGNAGLFDDWHSMLYFWVFTAVMLCLGAYIYRRLKPHFADVL
ncbi:MAG: ABC transporter permease [Lachnospiraceae bacterium]|nr:ABC transporter permease [Lachnospiraceae bacterium]